MKYDIAIVGGGPGGYVAAIKASQMGAKVVLFEEDKLGGTCLNRGCIPTKAILKSAALLHDIRTADQLGISAGEASVNLAKVVQRKNAIVSQLNTGVGTLLKRNKVTVVAQRATVRNAGQVCAGDEMYETDNVIIATGSSPVMPPIDGIENCVDSDAVLDTTRLPNPVVIIGGGVIGVEFATAFSNFGASVTIVEMADRLIPMADAEASDILLASLKEKGVAVYCGAKVVRCEKDTVVFQKNGDTLTAKGDLMLSCTGRKPNLDTAMLDALGIRHSKGHIDINSSMETSVKHIYAIGDVNGKLMLAHTASEEGVVAVRNIMGGHCTMDYSAIPQCIYTDPEIAWIGMTEREAADQGIVYKTGRFPMAANGKCLIEGQTSGYVKLLSRKDTDEIIGAHIVGPHATELIAEIGSILKAEGLSTDIASAVHAHPTLSEAVREAAMLLNGEAIHC